MRVDISQEVAEALETGRPVVALESTIISHGLPADHRLDAALEFEALTRRHGATPATIAVIDGTARVGLSAQDLQRLSEPSVHKASVRDLPVLSAKQLTGATTVAATAYLAARAGIRVFATGGLGGVHRGASQTFDESADLSTLSACPVAVVAAGVKSILDIAATLERLETLSVPVIGYGTSEFPAFWLRSSGISLDWRADSPAEIASVLLAQDVLGDGVGSMARGAVVANPIPVEQEWNREEHDEILRAALTSAERQGIRGKAVTPFLLQEIVEASGGKSLKVNLDLVRNNIRLASEISVAYHSPQN